MTDQAKLPNSGRIGGPHRLTIADVRAIRARSSESHVEIARDYGVTPEAIGNIQRRVTWKHVA